MHQSRAILSLYSRFCTKSYKSHKKTAANYLAHLFSTETGICSDDSDCGFGGLCIKNDSPDLAKGGSTPASPPATPKGQGRCHCEDNCPYIYNPVCSTEGTTFDNECHLKLAACRRRRPIRQKHSGECGKLHMIF